MTDAARDIFMTGLRNAHAMEVQARELMERQSQRVDDYPEVKAKLLAHLEETRTQIQRLDDILQACGDSASMVKDTAQSFMGNMMALAHTVAPDEILKNTFANNAFENFEIAAYKSLIALCAAAGFPQARAKLEASLKEEQAMAAWVDANVEKVTLAFVSHRQRNAA